MEQKITDNPETGARIGTETGPGTVSEPRSSNNQAEYDEYEHRPVPKTWKHQKSHPLDQILTDLNSGVQTRSKLKNFCTFYAFLSHIEPKNVYEALIDSDSREIRYDTWYPSQEIEQSLVPSGCSKTS